MKTRLPRHEIETICILLAMRDGTCPIETLAKRLGLAIALAEPLAACIEPLVRDGRIVTIDAGLSLSARGHAWLGARLEDVGLA
jgi:hypothetical protein